MKEIAKSIQHEIQKLLLKKRPILVAIDGRCASGKTTLASHLQQMFDCNVIHMDHFFLRPEQATQKRLSEAGENVDYERFLDEVLLPLKSGESFTYKPYDCKTQEMAAPIRIEARDVNIIEGSYCCHNALFEHYDLKIFLNVDKTKQIERIKRRNGEAGLVMFQNKWIPLEESYFSAFDIMNRCDYCFESCD